MKKNSISRFIRNNFLLCVYVIVFVFILLLGVKFWDKVDIPPTYYRILHLIIIVCVVLYFIKYFAKRLTKKKDE